MSKSKTVPEGLKDQECKKGSRMKCPKIPYVPVVSLVQDAVNTAKEYPMKIKLPDKPKSRYPFGIPFVFGVVGVRSLLRQLGS